jgi:hypothetical protein
MEPDASSLGESRSEKVLMSKKPISQSATKQKLMVHYLLWGKRIYWFHHDNKHEGKKLQDARDFAAKHGYDGISIVAPEKKYHE